MNDSKHLFRLGRLDDAAPLVQRGLQVATDASYWFGAGFAHRAAGRLARDRGAAADAWNAFQTALQLFVRIDAVFEAARTRLDLARAAADRGDFDAARRELTSAAATFQRLDEREYLDRTVSLAATLGAPIARIEQA